MDIVNVCGMMDIFGFLISLNEFLKKSQYDEVGRVVRRSMGNDVSQSYDFNDWETEGGRLETFTIGPLIDPLLNVAFGYDAVGNITDLVYSSGSPTKTQGKPSARQF